MFRQTKAKKSAKPVVDLDAIVSESQYVKFMGMTHELKPILVGEFFALANAYADVQSKISAPEINMDQIIDCYYSMIFPVIPSVTKQMIKDASHSQIAALIAFVQDHVSGKVTDEKKKTMVPLTVPNPLRSV